MNDLEPYRRLFDAVRPWRGDVPRGFRADFLGMLTDLRFTVSGSRPPPSAIAEHCRATAPCIDAPSRDSAKFWFEAANWVLAAMDARHDYVMVTLASPFGYQAVGSYRAIQQINPMACKLAVIDPDQRNIAYARKHFRDNGIDPEDHWFLQGAISGDNVPLFLPMGMSGSGIQGMPIEGREAYARDVLSDTRLVSAFTLRNVLGPFERVDYIAADVGESEIAAFPPFICLLKRIVRRIHINTKGKRVHRSLYSLFSNNGWRILFSYPPNSAHESALGSFQTNDGVLTVTNTTV
jgi:hypothetical protein